MANVMRDRRAALALSQADLAVAVGLDKQESQDLLLTLSDGDE